MGTLKTDTTQQLKVYLQLLVDAGERLEEGLEVFVGDVHVLFTAYLTHAAESNSRQLSNSFIMHGHANAGCTL